ncbi:MAG: hypothetical protein P4L26_02660 [Terracidiphilus sp.]|nr:hypothetical protein [Terracidiphilus sp.]
MKTLDRILACIVILGSFGHGVGSFLAYKHEPVTMLWALSTSMLWQLIAAINLLRTFRPGDGPLAWIAFAWSVAMAISAFTFGVLIGNVFDVRAVVNVFVSLGLAAFSLKAALGASRTHA